MTAATSKKTRSGRPTLAYVHRRSTSDWMRPPISKPTYRGEQPINLRVRYHDRQPHVYEAGPSAGGTLAFKDDLKSTFDELALRWTEETKAISAIEEMAMHPSYQRIIGMGPAVIPHIMRALEQRPDNWFWALRAITGADPVPPDQRGRTREMAQAWIVWARENHIDW